VIRLGLEIFSVGSPERRLLGIQYLSGLNDNMLSYLHCDNEEMATILKYTDNEWEFTKQLKNNIDNICISELTANGKIDLQNTRGPIIIPFREIGYLDLSHSSELNFPLLTTVFEDYLTMSHSSGLNFPILETVHGTIWADSAINATFQKLESIRGDLIITKAKNIVFENLKHIDGNVKTNEAYGIEFPRLSRISGRLNVGNGKNIRAPLLNHVGSIAKRLDSDLYAPLLPKRPMKIPYLPT
jgi:hypothetical protein